MRVIVMSLLAAAALDATQLIPESSPTAGRGAGKGAFVWNRDAFWSELEAQFVHAKSAGAGTLTAPINESLAGISHQLDLLATADFPANAPVFETLEASFFQLGPMVAASPDRLPDFVQAFGRMRSLVKQQSGHWPMEARETRERLYRLLYGGRAAIEEAMLQAPRDRVPPLLAGVDEPSQTPSAVVHGVTLHSGDMLVSRGDAATSALIARGNDFPGNFSHLALVHVDAVTHAVSVVEAQIECGVLVSPMATYLRDTKLRIMALRLRADLPALAADPLLPHKAAEHARQEAMRRHIPYDFAMDCNDRSKQFCAEVASAAYGSVGIHLWMGVSRLSTPGVISWLSALGVRHFETQEPSDLEYDPQLCVVAEWRDPKTLFNDHVDNAVTDVMLEAAERGEPLRYNLWQLPFGGLLKAYSGLKNWCGRVGPIPEGMSATTALRVQKLVADHAAIKARLLAGVEKFEAEHGYTPPYWMLVSIARGATRNPASGALQR
jgi:Permuted papain-like amidase enzyme, YaeF/YiiX, C92 family